jgi:hypothetical protein
MLRYLRGNENDLRAVYKTGLDDGVPLLGLTAIGMDWKSHLAYKDPEDGATVR